MASPPQFRAQRNQRLDISSTTGRDQSYPDDPAPQIDVSERLPTRAGMVRFPGWGRP